MTDRVKTSLWVSMALRMADSAGNPGMVIRKGDPDAGGLLAVLHTREGLIVLSQARTGEGEAAWMRATGPTPVTQEKADEYIQRQLKFDPDLWVVEFECPHGTPPFPAHIL